MTLKVNRWLGWFLAAIMGFIWNVLILGLLSVLFVLFVGPSLMLSSSVPLLLQLKRTIPVKSFRDEFEVDHVLSFLIRIVNDAVSAGLVKFQGFLGYEGFLFFIIYIWLFFIYDHGLILCDPLFHFVSS
jgi:hypothetical protein